MKPILKKILSYTAVAFLGFATGVGCLIGVSSCSQKNGQEEKQLNVQVNRKSLNIKASDISSIIGSSSTYYAVAKNYANYGRGVFYEGTISLSNSRIMSNSFLDLSLNIDIIQNDQVVTNRFCIRTALDSGVYKLQNIYLSLNSSSNFNFIYQPDNSVFNREYCAFVFKNAKYAFSSGGNALSFFSDLFDIYDLSDPYNQYIFNDTFNYNNFYQVGDTFLSRGNSGVVNAVGQTAQTMTYNLGWFYSGGLVFDQVNAYFYVTSYNYFQTHDNTWVKYESNAVSNYYLYFHHMEYVNSATNYSITACNRIVMPHGNEAGWTDIYLECAWTNQDFKVIELQDEVRNIKTKNVFESLVSNVLGGFTEINNDIDVGLGDVFTLISTAFSAWIPIFNIQIVPGVTIGLLLFLPLITGIIIVIIWIVKR